MPARLTTDMTYEKTRIAILDATEPSTPRTVPILLPKPFRVWNDTATDYPRDKSVAQLFEEVAAQFPENIAVVFAEERITYGELNRRANRLAHRLRRMGVTTETMVGCCIERSTELIVALLAVLKAGGAFVPLDPAYPQERFDLLLEETRPAVVLTQRSLAATVLAGRNLASLSVDEVPATVMPSADDENPQPAGGPRSLAYLMFTSGSTGRPKGVLIENRSIVRLVRNTQYCQFGPDQVQLLFAPISFDASTFEIWGALLNGGRLVVMPPQTSSLEDLGRTIREQGVTTLWLTSGLFHLMVEQRLSDLASVQQLLAGGDVLSARHVRLALQNLPQCRVINGYGPTENTTFTCCHPMQSGDVIPDSVPLGGPISNTQVYILDEQMQPVAPGEVGEIYAAGDGVARGYLNRADLTDEKFLADPFVEDGETRMYRTGDLGRWRGDGTIEFCGRTDNQLKLLGHRIEPGEIESVLSRHDGVQQVCVVPHSDGNGSKRLVAYYIAGSSAGAAACELKAYLSARLPQYMIPAFFVPVAAMPLSPNGKVDRAAFPAPLGGVATPTPQAPSTALEETLKDLWQRALQVQPLNLDDNFFDLGADSLTIVGVHSSLQKKLQREIPVTDLFEFSTIRSLSRHLSAGVGEQNAPGPAFSEQQQQAQRQRDAFARQRQRRGGGSQ
ncbi:MAG TPA: non-ribosomal peptide synthetase [Candidatus Sulfotelmatobacter sp.]|jgi:aspartate racemase